MPTIMMISAATAKGSLWLVLLQVLLILPYSTNASYLFNEIFTGIPEQGDCHLVGAYLIGDVEDPVTGCYTEDLTYEYYNGGYGGAPDYQDTGYPQETYYTLQIHVVRDCFDTRVNPSTCELTVQGVGVCNDCRYDDRDYYGIILHDCSNLPGIFPDNGRPQRLKYFGDIYPVPSYEEAFLKLARNQTRCLHPALNYTGTFTPTMVPVSDAPSISSISEAPSYTAEPSTFPSMLMPHSSDQPSSAGISEAPSQTVDPSSTPSIAGSVTNTWMDVVRGDAAMGHCYLVLRHQLWEKLGDDQLNCDNLILTYNYYNGGNDENGEDTGYEQVDYTSVDIEVKYHCNGPEYDICNVHIYGMGTCTEECTFDPVEQQITMTGCSNYPDVFAPGPQTVAMLNDDDGADDDHEIMLFLALAFDEDKCLHPGVQDHTTFPSMVPSLADTSMSPSLSDTSMYPSLSDTSMYPSLSATSMYPSSTVYPTSTSAPSMPGFQLYDVVRGDATMGDCYFVMRESKLEFIDMETGCVRTNYLYRYYNGGVDENLEHTGYAPEYYAHVNVWVHNTCDDPALDFCMVEVAGAGLCDVCQLGNEGEVRLVDCDNLNGVFPPGIQEIEVFGEGHTESSYDDKFLSLVFDEERCLHPTVNMETSLTPSIVPSLGETSMYPSQSIVPSHSSHSESPSSTNNPSPTMTQTEHDDTTRGDPTFGDCFMVERYMQNTTQTVSHGCSKLNLMYVYYNGGMDEYGHDTGYPREVYYHVLVDMITDCVDPTRFLCQVKVLEHGVCDTACTYDAGAGTVTFGCSDLDGIFPPGEQTVGFYWDDWDTSYVQAFPTLAYNQSMCSHPIYLSQQPSIIPTWYPTMLPPSGAPSDSGFSQTPSLGETSMYPSNSDIPSELPSWTLIPSILPTFSEAPSWAGHSEAPSFLPSETWAPSWYPPSSVPSLYPSQEGYSESPSHSWVPTWFPPSSVPSIWPSSSFVPTWYPPSTAPSQTWAPSMYATTTFPTQLPPSSAPSELGTVGTTEVAGFAESMDCFDDYSGGLTEENKCYAVDSAVCTETWSNGCTLMSGYFEYYNQGNSQIPQSKDLYHFVLVTVIYGCNPGENPDTLENGCIISVGGQECNKCSIVGDGEKISMADCTNIQGVFQPPNGQTISLSEGGGSFDIFETMAMCNHPGNSLTADDVQLLPDQEEDTTQTFDLRLAFSFDFFKNKGIKPDMKATMFLVTNAIDFFKLSFLKDHRFTDIILDLTFDDIVPVYYEARPDKFAFTATAHVEVENSEAVSKLHATKVFTDSNLNDYLRNYVRHNQSGKRNVFYNMEKVHLKVSG